MTKIKAEISETENRPKIHKINYLKIVSLNRSINSQTSTYTDQENT